MKTQQEIIYDLAHEFLQELPNTRIGENPSVAQIAHHCFCEGARRGIAAVNNPFYSALKMDDESRSHYLRGYDDAIKQILKMIDAEKIY